MIDEQLEKSINRFTITPIHYWIVKNKSFHSTNNIGIFKIIEKYPITEINQ